MTPRIILPADTTVTVGDTLWWGVEGERGPRRLGAGAQADSVTNPDVAPPEWQALTEACHQPPPSLALELAGEAHCDRCDPDCHKGRRTVEVACGHPLHDTRRLDGGWGVCAPHRCRAGVLGRAVIDGDWVPIVGNERSQRPSRYIWIPGDGTAQEAVIGRSPMFQPITLHGHTDPGGYAARFEVIA